MFFIVELFNCNCFSFSYGMKLLLTSSSFVILGNDHSSINHIYRHQTGGHFALKLISILTPVCLAIFLCASVRYASRCTHRLSALKGFISQSEHL